MKCISFLFLFTISLIAQENIYSQKINVLEAEKLKIATNYFEALEARSAVSRAKIRSFIKQFNSQKDKALSGKDIETLQNGILKQVYLREEFYRVINTYKRYPYITGEETMINMDNRLKGGLLALAAACVLFDNYLLCLQEVQNNTALRRLINKGDGGVRVAADHLQLVVDSANSRENRKKFRDALDWFLKHRQKLQTLEQNDPQLTTLENAIKKSHSAKVLGRGNLFSDYFKSIASRARKARDSVASVGDSSMNSISKVFGNSIGAVQFRKGMLYGDKKVEDDLIAELKPLDVILEKTPFRLTDKFIPGHFGHVAIWVGTEEQLKNFGMWEHELIKPYHEEIKNGCCVLEALRDGVQLNTLSRFLDVDDLAILRKQDKNNHKCLVRAFQQLGKEYDFNFDVQTSDKIVCSELVYHVFVDVDWPTEETMGRYTISPDNVAVKAVNGPFDMKLFVHKGKGSSYDMFKALLEKQ